MKRTDNPKGRTYEINGVLYPSVTSVLSCYPKSEVFLAWLARQGSMQEADKAKVAGGSRGTNVHHAVEALLRGEDLVLDNFTPEEQYGIKAAQQWIKDYQPKVIWIERTVHSPLYGYAGTADCYYVSPSGERVLMDWKTSKGIWPSYEVQLQAYAQAMKEAGEPTDKLMIVRLPTKEGQSYEAKEYQPSAERMKIFLACLTLWHETHPEFTSSPS